MNARDGYVTLYIMFLHSFCVLVNSITIIHFNFSLEIMVLGILPNLFIYMVKLCAKEKRNGTTD